MTQPASEPDPMRLSVEDLGPQTPFPQICTLLKCASDEGRLDEVMDLFLLAWRPALVRQAFTLVHMRGLDPHTWADEALSVVMHEVADRVPRLVAEDRVVQNLLGFLRLSITRRWDKFLDSTGGLDGRKERDNVQRRLVRLHNLRAAYLQQIGTEPVSDSQFLAWANTEQAKTHADPARSGMVFTAADLTAGAPMLSTDVEGGDQLARVDDVDAGPGPLAPVDRKRLARSVIDRGTAIDETLGKVAGIVFGPQTTDCPGPLPRPFDVARELRIGQLRATLLIAQTHELARDILATDFGITDPR